MTADEKALVERAKNPIVTTVMRYVHESRNHKGMIVGMPKVTLDSSQAEYLCRTIAHQSEEIDMLARALVDADNLISHYIKSIPYTTRWAIPHAAALAIAKERS
jgi:catabolite regulation protein CreA